MPIGCALAHVCADSGMAGADEPNIVATPRGQLPLSMASSSKDALEQRPRHGPPLAATVAIASCNCARRGIFGMNGRARLPRGW
jgi:hypothetical protein